MAVVVHSVSIQDGARGFLILQKLFECIKHSLYNRYCRLKLIWDIGAYTSIMEKVCKQFGWVLEIIKRSDARKGFKVLPHGWVIERTFGWLGRYRRLARDYEHTTSSSESMIYVASCQVEHGGLVSLVRAKETMFKPFRELLIMRKSGTNQGVITTSVP